MKYLPIAILLIAAIVAGISFTGSYAAKERKIWRYINEHAQDVIELKKGNKIIGKVVGEVSKEVMIYNFQKNIDEIIDKKNILVTRKPAAEELKQLRMVLKKSGREKEILGTGNPSVKRYNSMRSSEVSVAYRAKSDLTARLVNEKEKEKNEQEEFEKQFEGMKS